MPLRKKGKLPHATVRVPYSLEYGLDEMELHRDALTAGERILLVDDLLATGGTAEAAVKLLRSLGAQHPRRRASSSSCPSSAAQPASPRSRCR